MEPMACDSEGRLVSDAPAPGMLSRPAEPAEPLAHTYELPAVLALRQVVAGRLRRRGCAVAPEVPGVGLARLGSG